MRHVGPPADAGNNVLVVAGMHRSGTSVVTHWLHACGLQVGEDLLAGASGNVEGHFEDIEFLKLHEDILLTHGADFAGLHAERAVVAPSVYDKAKMRAIIGVKNARFRQWGWKEPRTCLFLDTYAELLPQAKYFVVQRDYEAVIGSLIQRDFSYLEQRYLARGWLTRTLWTHVWRPIRFERHCRKHAERYLRAWVLYNRMILTALADLPEQRYLVVSYHMLKSQSADVFNFLSSRWQFTLRHQEFSSIFKGSLISKSVSFLPHIADQALLAQANDLSDRFSTYLGRSRERLSEETLAPA
jgi:hypothetical protein